MVCFANNLLLHYHFAEVYQSFHNLFHLVHVKVHNEENMCTSEQEAQNLRGAKRSPELAFRSTDFHVPENLIFPALHSPILLFYKKINKWFSPTH